MTNLLALTKVLQALQLSPQQDNGSDYLRVHCPMHQSKPSHSHRPSGSFHLGTGRYHCFNCKAGAKSVEDFLLLLEMDTRYRMKQNPDQAPMLKTKLVLVNEALEALNTSQAIKVSTAIYNLPEIH